MYYNGGKNISCTKKAMSKMNVKRTTNKHSLHRCCLKLLFGLGLPGDVVKSHPFLYRFTCLQFTKPNDYVNGNFPSVLLAAIENNQTNLNRIYDLANSQDFLKFESLQTEQRVVVQAVMVMPVSIFIEFDGIALKIELFFYRSKPRA